MEKLKRMLLAALMCGVVSAGALAQKQDPKEPPPKQDQPRVKVEENKNPPPERREPKGEDKKKP
jgi:hypothetical protein